MTQESTLEIEFTYDEIAGIDCVFIGLSSEEREGYYNLIINIATLLCGNKAGNVRVTKDQVWFLLNRVHPSLVPSAVRIHIRKKLWEAIFKFNTNYQISGLGIPLGEIEEDPQSVERMLKGKQKHQRGEVREDPEIFWEKEE